MSITFVDSNEAKLWMIANQRGRRNLTDGWKFELAQVEKTIMLEIGQAKKEVNLKQNTSTEVSIIDTSDKSHSTRKIIAATLGWSTGKIAMANRVWKCAKPDIKERVLSGEASIHEAYVAVKNNSVLMTKCSGDEEWYTPSQYIESARAVLGQFDVDPASNPVAQQTVKATTDFTKDDDGLSKTWIGRVWLNPPFTARIINLFIDKMIAHYQSGEISEAIVLTNNATDTSWFHNAVKVAQAICFTSGRINFYKNNGAKSTPTNGQVFFYFGKNVDSFNQEFSKYGWVVKVNFGGHSSPS